MAEQGPFKPDFAVTTVSASGRVAVVVVRGELDSGGCEELLWNVQCVLSSDPSELSLDLNGLTFIDSAGMRALIMVERLAAESRTPLTVTPAPEAVTDLLQTAGLVNRGDGGAEPISQEARRFIERTELELPRDPHSPARARAEVRECVSQRGGPDQVANLVLLTSELVTNAVVHPRGVGDTPITLRVTAYDSGVRIDVEDNGRGFERRRPVLPEGERGRGLFLVDQFSDRWGSGLVDTPAGERFQVWFELTWPGQGTQAVA